MSLAKITLIGMSNYDPDLFKDAFFPEGIDKDLVINALLMQGGEFEVLYPNPDFMKRSITVWCSKWYRTFAEWYKGTQASWNPIYNYDRMEEIRDESRKRSDSKTTADYSDKRTADLTDKRTVSLKDERIADLTDERTADLNEKRTADLTDKRTAALQDETVTGSTENVSNVGTDTTSQLVKSTTEHLVSAYDSSSYQPSSKDIIDNGTNSVAHNNDVENVKEGTEVNKHTGYDIMDHTGTDETATTGTDTMTHTGTDTTEHSGYDTMDHTGTDENIRKGTLADTSGSEQNTNIHTAHMYGNIGVTTSAAMLKEFYDIARWNLYEHISDVFISELLIPVY